MDDFVKQIYQGIVDGQQEVVVSGVTTALESGVPARTILEEGMLAAMAVAGRLFEEGDCYVPEMRISARAMKAGLTALQPSMKQTSVRAAGTIALGKKGDFHDLDKNLVGMMLEGAGLTVKDVGVGGAPVTEDSAHQIGADGYSPDASRAVALAKVLTVPNRLGLTSIRQLPSSRGG